MALSGNNNTNDLHDDHDDHGSFQQRLNNIFTPRSIQEDNLDDDGNDMSSLEPALQPETAEASSSTFRDRDNDVVMAGTDHSSTAGPSSSSLDDTPPSPSRETPVDSSSFVPTTDDVPPPPPSLSSNRRARVDDEMDVEDMRETNRQRINSPPVQSPDLPPHDHPHPPIHDVPQHHGHGQFIMDEPGGHRVVFDIFVGPAHAGPPPTGVDQAHAMPNIPGGAMVFNIPLGGNAGQGANDMQGGAAGQQNPQTPADLLEHIRQQFANPPADFMQMLMGGLGFGGEEPDDPERAKRLVAGLEEVPPGLVKRLERVGGEEGEGGPNCAVCWESLVDGDGGFELKDEKDMKEPEKTPEQPMTSEPSEAPVASSSAAATNADLRPPKEETSARPRIVALPCSHVFHANCLLPWFTRPHRTTCPTCRFDIDPESLTYVPRPLHRRQTRQAPTPAGQAQDQQQPTPGVPANEQQTQPPQQTTASNIPPNIPPPPAPAGPRPPPFASLFDGFNNTFPHPPAPVNLPPGVRIPTPPMPAGPRPLHQPLPVSHTPSPVNLPPGVRIPTPPRPAPPRPVAQPVPISLSGLGPNAYRPMNPMSTPMTQAGTSPFAAGTSNAGNAPTTYTPIGHAAYQMAYVDVPPLPYARPQSTRAEQSASRPASTPAANLDGAPTAAAGAGPSQTMNPPAANAQNQNTNQTPGQDDAGAPPPYLAFDISFVVPVAPAGPFGAPQGVPAQANAAAAATPQPAPAPPANAAGNPPPVAPQPIPRVVPQMFGGGFNIPPVGVGHAFNIGLGLPGGVVPPPRPASAPTTGQSAHRGQVPVGGFPFTIPVVSPAPQPQPRQGRQPQQRAAGVPPAGNPAQNLMQAFSRALFQAMTDAMAHEGQQTDEQNLHGAEHAAPADGQQRPAQAPVQQQQALHNLAAQQAFADLQLPTPNQVPTNLEQATNANADAQGHPAPPHTHFHIHNPTNGEIDDGIFIPLFGNGFPRAGRRGTGQGGENAPRKPQWTLPPAPGLTLRERIEKREREIGLRCSDISCGVGPSDEDPEPVVDPRNIRQIGIRRQGTGKEREEYVCDHKFHTACLVSAERVAGWGADEKEEDMEDRRMVGEEGQDEDVEVSCPVCRAVGCVSRADWEEGAWSIV
ncbi:unnamed protein product [Somion occarium]|uniref:RING-type domain-containing protein n=1 Tax=Somion occarium TaxID=3059160 RepID=A0ABP1DWT7_9APHY